jgi:tRNA nucleotidyltransferase/poly(A) polymerase
MSTKAVFRTIAHAETHRNKGYEKHRAVGGSVRLTLDGCGHTQSRKISQGIPVRVRCKECESVRDGSARKTKIGDGDWTTQVWDSERNVPVTVTVQEQLG